MHLWLHRAWELLLETPGLDELDEILRVQVAVFRSVDVLAGS